ncbi:MAG: hypothetical protein Tp1111DCM1126091_21 [Prokaryotic dsDNA virus sp.]|nr:MAG: hypothetical protein Tp1111DCM1126091_21 [Prokaryotic dsDNA virus sp.]
MKTQISNLTLPTQDQSYMQYMNVQYKLERIRRNSRLSFKCKLAAMIASDNRTGKVWS